jgi:hypothetical protein
VSRRLIIAGIVVGVVVFVVISGLLARAFSVDGAERSAITGLVQAEARGDQDGVLSRIQGCDASAACRTRVAQDVAALEHPGSVSILTLQTSAGFSLTGTVGTARVAWNVASSLPIVQCVRVRRAGNVFSGLRVELLTLSTRIKSDSDCPTRF